MNYSFENQGSFLYEPSVSEQTMVDKIDQFEKYLTVNENTSVRLSIPTDTHSRPDLELFRSLKELESVTSHKPPAAIDFYYRYDPTWKQLALSGLGYPIPSSPVLRIEAERDNGEFQTRIVALDSKQEIPRSPLSLATVESITNSIGIPTAYREPSVSALRSELMGQLSPQGTVVLKHRQQVFHHGVEEYGGAFEAGAYIQTTEEVGAESLIKTTEIISSISTDSEENLEVVQLTSSDGGKGISAERVAIDNTTDTAHRSSLPLDYEHIEHFLKRFDAIEKHLKDA